MKVIDIDGALYKISNIDSDKLEKLREYTIINKYSEDSEVVEEEYNDFLDEIEDTHKIFAWVDGRYERV